MLHHSTKYQQNSVTHFLNMHSSGVVESTANVGGYNNQIMDPNIIDLNSQSSPLSSNGHSIDGKSFTIAAILGLNNNNNNSRNFNEVVNLSLNQTNKLFGGLERLPQLYNGAYSATSSVNGSNNGHSYQQQPGHALKNLQQQFSQHMNTDFVSREKYRNVLDQTSGKKSVLKSKRVRTIFTPEQLERLEAEFERQQYMVGPERLYLAHTLQLTEAQVKVWFQNRRIKWRKHHLEVTQQRLALIRHQQKQLGTDTKKIQNEENEQQDLRLPSISPELTVCSDSMDANTESETE